MTAMAVFYILLALLMLATVYFLGNVKRDYRVRRQLMAGSAVGGWALYGLHGALTGFAAWHGVWPLPLNTTLAIAMGGVAGVLGLIVSMAGLVAFDPRGTWNREAARVSAGIYRWSRNPQNLGWALILLAMALNGKSALALALMILFGVTVHFYLVRVEEPYLQRVFGQAYRRYRTRTGRYFRWPRRGRESTSFEHGREVP